MQDPSRARREMVDLQIRARGISDPRVLSAMLRVPRDLFVPEADRERAYEDHPLPIGSGQTISQPYVVALMLQSLEISANEKVLEVGTGSGYATALLGELAGEVVSLERHPALAENSRKALEKLGYSNVKVLTGDGCLGLPEAAPFDVILVSAAALEIPVALIRQLREGGRMIIPVGTDDSQQLQFVRIINGQPAISLRDLVRFVPLVPGQVPG